MCRALRFEVDWRLTASVAASYGRQPCWSSPEVEVYEWALSLTE